MNLGKSRLFALAAAHGASLLAVPAVLQAAPAEGALEEIVVTARQREERIENVPVSITAFTAADIRSAGIDRPQDFIALTPGMAQVQTAEVGDLQVTIRGINTGRDAEPNFALVIDGVLQTNPNALNQELANVTQIEVLKGPQGAVYGRNALAGALIVTTRKPGDEWERDLRAGFGSDDSYNGNFYAGGPLGDSVKGSFSAYTRKTDGQWRNIKLDCEDCVDYFEETGVSGRLLFGLAGGELDFRAKYSELDAGAINFNGSIALADVAPFVGPAFYEDPNKHNFRYINNVEPRNEQENVNLSLKGDWDVGIGTLTSYVAYNDQTNYFLTDGTSDAFLLYAFNDPANNSEAAATCQQTNDDNLTVPGYEAPFFGIPSSLWLTPEGGGGAGFLPPYFDLRRLPVPAARPGGPELRAAPDLAWRPAPALAGRRLLRGHPARRRRLARLGPRRQPAGPSVRSGGRSEPDRPALRRHVRQHRLCGLRTARL
jgi:iron complex outermembrane recepter protein